MNKLSDPNDNPIGVIIIAVLGVILIIVLERYPIRLYRIHRPQNSLCIRRV
jgi:hypothetical protein